jgi:hypothetical protein
VHITSEFNAEEVKCALNSIGDLKALNKMVCPLFSTKGFGILWGYRCPFGPQPGSLHESPPFYSGPNPAQHGFLEKVLGCCGVIDVHLARSPAACTKARLFSPVRTRHSTAFCGPGLARHGSSDWAWATTQHAGRPDPARK